LTWYLQDTPTGAKSDIHGLAELVQSLQTAIFQMRSPGDCQELETKLSYMYPLA